MSIAGIFEVEEQVGRVWHRLVGDRASYRPHPEARVTLESVQRLIGLVFRGLGGAPTARLVPVAAAGRSHRLTLRQKLGMAEERLAVARSDGETIALPPTIDVFPDADRNRDLYLWLAAYFAVAPEIASLSPLPADAGPLAADIAAIGQAALICDRVMRLYPGLAALYGRIAAALPALRPQRHLPPLEAAVEALVLALLSNTPPSGPAAVFAQVATGDRPYGSLPRAPRSYRPFLPVPLWGEIAEAPHGRRAENDTDDEDGAGSETDGRRRKGKRRSMDMSEREDGLILNRFDKLLSLAEAVNVNRATDDEDEEDAKKAADDLDEITLAPNAKRIAAKLRLDLDLAPGEDVGGAIVAETVVPEWDYRTGRLLPAHCRVVASPATLAEKPWLPDDEARRRIARVRRQFEALRPRRLLLRAQMDGDELDIEAVVRAAADRASGSPGSDRLYQQHRSVMRDVSAALLVDVSLSTDAQVRGRRVIDVARETLGTFTAGLAACGDEHGVFTFTSRRREWLRIQTVKDFDERPASSLIGRRIAGLKPGYYTRIGPAIRHVSSLLEERPQRHRLLLLLTDGKPNDLDHYDGRYGLEDSWHAVMEARRRGLAVFGITIDGKAQEYFPFIFGPGGFAIVEEPSRLSLALPKLYRQLTA